MVTVIGLSGPAGSGKSTVAEYLARTYGARLYAFADPLKLIIQRAFDVPREYLWGTQAQKEQVIPGLNMSGRFLMQRIGTEGIRHVFGDQFWAQKTMEKIETDGSPLVVIEDVRFVSEAAYMREWCESVGHGRPVDPCHIWRLTPPPSEGPTADPTHASESDYLRVRPDDIITPPVKDLGWLYTAVDILCTSNGISPILHSLEH